MRRQNELLGLPISSHFLRFGGRGQSAARSLCTSASVFSLAAAGVRLALLASRPLVDRGKKELTATNSGQGQAKEEGEEEEPMRRFALLSPEGTERGKKSSLVTLEGQKGDAKRSAKGVGGLGQGTNVLEMMANS